MRVFRDETRFRYILSIIFGAGTILAGCATINYSYDPVADFSTIKSYNWGKESFVYREEPLIEKNVRYYADQSLKNKGFTLNSAKSDFLISMNYDLDSYNPYKVQKLYLYIYRMPGKELIWQGTSSSIIKDIKVDAASQDLGKAVKNILRKFPPKR